MNARLAILLLVTVLLLRTESAAHTGNATRVDRLSAPAEVQAGDTFAVKLVGSGTDTAHLTVVQAGQAWRVSAQLNDGRATLYIGAPATNRAGRLLLYSSSASTSVDVLPNELSVPLEPLVGPRSIIADGQDRTMVVLLPQDENGNLRTDTPTVAVRHFGGTEDIFPTHFKTAVSYALVSSGFVAGATSVRSISKGIPGSRSGFEEVAGPPTSFNLSVAASNLRADGRTRVLITTGPLYDSFHNQLPDGVLVRFEILDGDTFTTIPTVTFESTAEIWMPAPDHPTVLRISAAYGNTKSEVAEVEFAAAVHEIPVALNIHPATTDVTIGPVVDGSGTLVADGTTVHLDNRRAQLQMGSATFDDVGAGIHTVEVLGVTTQFSAPL